MAYDVFGNGKTALKVSLDKYMVAQGLQGIYGDQADPIGRLANMVTRSWNDLLFPVGDPRRANFVPDCSLTNPQQNDECGIMSNTSFGSTIPATTYNQQALVGWGVRPDSWEFSASVQHEVVSRVSVNVGYFRRWYGNFTVTDNLAVAPTDYSPFSVTAPIDPRLPDGGGSLVTGLYDLNPNKAGQVNNYFTLASDYGTQLEHWNGIDFTVNARPGMLVQAGSARETR
jgi:hypothetical protein